MMAELNFRFWVGLLGRQYENPWRVQLRQILINTSAPLLRKEAHKAIKEIRFLRNRIAYHEPILQRPLTREHALLLTVIRWLCGISANWVSHHSRFDDVYRVRP